MLGTGAGIAVAAGLFWLLMLLLVLLSAVLPSTNNAIPAVPLLAEGLAEADKELPVLFIAAASAPGDEVAATELLTADPMTVFGADTAGLGPSAVAGIPGDKLALSLLAVLLLPAEEDNAAAQSLTLLLPHEVAATGGLVPFALLVCGPRAPATALATLLF